MLNKIVLIGRLVRDPEYRALSDGTSVCNFTLAVDDDFKDKDGSKVTDFVECTAWRKTAEYITRYQLKGALLAVTGRLKSRKWTDREGNKRTSWFVSVDNAYGVGGKQEAPRNGTYQGGIQAGADFAPPNPGYTQAAIAPDGDYAILTDDDAALPF